MTLGEMLKFPHNDKIIIRQLEKLERKQIKANMAILTVAILASILRKNSIV